MLEWFCMDNDSIYVFLLKLSVLVNWWAHKETSPLTQTSDLGTRCPLQTSYCGQPQLGAAVGGQKILQASCLWRRRWAGACPADLKVFSFSSTAGTSRNTAAAREAMVLHPWHILSEWCSQSGCWLFRAAVSGHEHRKCEQAVLWRAQWHMLYSLGKASSHSANTSLDTWKRSRHLVIHYFYLYPAVLCHLWNTHLWDKWLKATQKNSTNNATVWDLSCAFERTISILFPW